MWYNQNPPFVPLFPKNRKKRGENMSFQEKKLPMPNTEKQVLASQTYEVGKLSVTCVLCQAHPMEEQSYSYSLWMTWSDTEKWQMIGEGMTQQQAQTVFHVLTENRVSPVHVWDVLEDLASQNFLCQNRQVKK